MIEISKSDWKLFRERISVWQEQYMEKLAGEYIKLLSAPGNASDHFWELEKRVNRDKKCPGVILELSKADAIWDMARLIKDKVIVFDDLDGFSDETVESVKRLLRR